MGSRLVYPVPVWPGRKVLVLAVLLAMPTGADAFSLGEIRVNSSFGEPFHAEVPLTLHPDEEAKGVEAAVADPDAYQILNLSRDLVVTQLRTRIEGKGASRRVFLSSDAPLRIPFFNLLLKTAVGTGSHYRNYPVSLTIPRPEGAAKAVNARRTYGPVRSGESLSSIAKSIPPDDMSLAQRVAALWTVNKNSNIINNIDELPVGVTLDLPTREEVAGLSAAAAARFLEDQRRAQRVPAGDRQAGTSAVRGESVKPTVGKRNAPVAAPSSVQEKRNREKTPETISMDALAKLTAENQRLADSVKMAWDRLELLTGQVTDVVQRGQQDAMLLTDLQNQLADTQRRLQRLEERSASVPVPAPPLSSPLEPKRLLPPPPTVVAEPPFYEMPGMEYAGAGVAGVLAAMLWWVRSRRQRREATLPMPGAGDSEGDSVPVESVVRDDVVVAPEPDGMVVTPTPRERAAASTAGEESKVMESFPAGGGLPLSPPDRVPLTAGQSRTTLSVAEALSPSLLLSPIDRDVPSSPMAEYADAEAVEIADDSDDEESIFKDLLESPPPARTQNTLPRAAATVGKVGQGGEDGLDMFEFDSPVSGVANQKTVPAASKSAVAPPASTEPVALEWVVDEK
ncbi:MAG: hypothetical protein H7838_05755 [Magnetococcus sp. DMHC-8]